LKNMTHTSAATRKTTTPLYTRIILSHSNSFAPSLITIFSKLRITCAIWRLTTAKFEQLSVQRQMGHVSLERFVHLRRHLL
jgi:hypothetical protein